MLHFICKQECIPVGCVPFAAVAVCPGGGSVYSRGMSALGEYLLRGVVSALGGWCLFPGGVSTPRGLLLLGCMLPGGVCSWGGVCSQGVSAPAGGSAPGGGVCSRGWYTSIH